MKVLFIVHDKQNNKKYLFKNIFSALKFGTNLEDTEIEKVEKEFQQEYFEEVLSNQNNERKDF